MQHTLVAVFDNRSDAQSAMDELLASGFTRDNVYVSSADLTGQAGTSSYASSTVDTTTTTGTTHEEGIGASIKHFFENLFGSDNDEHVTRYSSVVSAGQHVLTLTTTSEPEVERAADVIERFGPVDIDERHDLQGDAASLGTSAYQPGTSSSMAAGSMQSSTQTGNLSGNLSDARTDSLQRDTSIDQTTGKAAIPVVQEDVKIGKRLVERGGVRVFSRVVETPVNETVNLREEHVNVERRPVDQPINPADVGAFKDKTIELREKAEEAVVQKSARVVEEVVVGKQVSQRQQQVQDTVRHTEVEVQPLQGTGTNLDDDTYYRNDWQTNYASQGGTYDDYAPAYRYGYEMRRDPRYQGRDWDAVESDLRSDWDTRYGSSGVSTWERMKAAVRSGWNRMTS
ncbi:MAG: DUF2382 domain-containing protein [Massilia sp.]|nr:DUF2382 domain-containing protein [Massilia sp.]